MVSKQHFKDVSFHGIPFSVSPTGMIKINPLSQVLLKIECVKPGVHTELGKFILSHAPAIPSRTLKAAQRDYPDIKR